MPIKLLNLLKKQARKEPKKLKLPLKVLPLKVMLPLRLPETKPTKLLRMLPNLLIKLPTKLLMLPNLLTKLMMLPRNENEFQF